MVTWTIFEVTASSILKVDDATPLPKIGPTNSLPGKQDLFLAKGDPSWLLQICGLRNEAIVRSGGRLEVKPSERFRKFLEQSEVKMSPLGAVH